MKTASWVIVEKDTKKPIFETFNEKTANAINSKRYTAIPILEYLQAFNQGVKLPKFALLLTFLKPITAQVI